MNGTSAGEPLRIIVEGLRELDAIAVGVEDVDDPHLPGELEHGADFDALARGAGRPRP